MSDSGPSALVKPDDERGPLLFGMGALVALLAIARFASHGDLTGVLAGAALVGVPLVALRLGGQAGMLFLIAASLGSRAAFRADPADGAAVLAIVLLLKRLAFVAAPPLVLGLALPPRDLRRFGLGPAHLYAPAVVMGLAGAIHLAVSWGVETADDDIKAAAIVYAFCYGTLILVALLLRLQSVGSTPSASAPAVPRGVEFEEKGRFSLAARAFENEGDLEKAAEMAERAGDWSRAARLYRQTEKNFNAAEMYCRAEMWPEALESYELAHDLGAAARLCLRVGQVDRAVSLYEKGGDAAGVVRALEEAGRRPSAEQYRKAGLLDRMAVALAESGEWVRSAEVYEHELDDPDRAVAAYLEAGAFLPAARLLESLGRRQEALEAFAAAPDGALDAARLYLAAGRSREAVDLFAQVRGAQLDQMEDEATLTQVARALVEARRNEEALRVLQRLKRRGGAGGAGGGVHLLLGRVFRNKKMPELAEEELRAATSMPLDPADEMEAAYSLGCVLEETGKNAEALQVFHDLLQKRFSYADVQQRYRRLKVRETSDSVRHES